MMQRFVRHATFTVRAVNAFRPSYLKQSRLREAVWRVVVWSHYGYCHSAHRNKHRPIKVLLLYFDSV